MKIKKWLSVILCLCLLMPVMSSCGENVNPPIESESDTGNVTTDIGSTSKDSEETKNPSTTPTTTTQKEIVSPENPDAIAVMVNQLGYLPNDKKVAVVTGGGRTFDVVNAETGAIVLSGMIEAWGEDVGSGDNVNYADFSALTEPGNYYLWVNETLFSYPFTIADGLYDGLLDDMLKTIFYQRCGYHLPDGYSDPYAHAACHTADRCWAADKVNGQDVSCGKDLTGGWHDAGDFSVQVVSTSLTAAFLMDFYLMYPDVFDDAVGIPESGNGIPDILDEARWGVEWLMKMQMEDGGVLRRTEAWGQPSLGTRADQDSTIMYAYPVSTGSTGNMAATCALAARVYQDIDPEFAQTCLEAAKRAYAWLEANPDYVYPYPGNFYGATTEFIGTSEKDEVLWAKVELYASTQDKSYLDGIARLTSEENLTGFSYHDRGGMAMISVILGKGLGMDEDVYDAFTYALKSDARKTKRLAEENGYRIPYNKSEQQYNYGFNQRISRVCDRLILAEMLDSQLGDPSIVSAMLDYLLGTNPLNFSYITGYGTNSVQYHYHSYCALGMMFPGVMMPGPGDFDAVAQTHKTLGLYLSEDTPLLKTYVDSLEYYRFNEWVVDSTPLAMWLVLDRMVKAVQ